MRVIAVVFGAVSPKERNAQVTKMLDYAFSQYITYPIYKRGEVLGEAKVSKGQKKTVVGVTSEPISVLTAKNGTAKDFTKKSRLIKIWMPRLKKVMKLVRLN